MEGEREKEKEREEETRIREKKGDFCCEIFSISWRFKEKSIQQLEKIVFLSLSFFSDFLGRSVSSISTSSHRSRSHFR